MSESPPPPPASLINCSSAFSGLFQAADRYKKIVSPQWFGSDWRPCSERTYPDLLYHERRNRVVRGGPTFCRSNYYYFIYFFAHNNICQVITSRIPRIPRQSFVKLFHDSRPYCSTFVTPLCTVMMLHVYIRPNYRPVSRVSKPFHLNCSHPDGKGKMYPRQK